MTATVNPTNTPTDVQGAPDTTRRREPATALGDRVAGNGTSERRSPTLGRWLAVARIATGFIFLWAFLDKTFGLGFTTPAARAWVNGGSPTSGFLSHADIGPLAPTFQAMAGSPVLDFLFMAGMLGVGVALILGVGLRVAAVAGSLIMVLMWAAEWPMTMVTTTGEPSGSTNPVVDYHLVYALMLIVLALSDAGRTWGLGRWWQGLPIVQKQRWLR